jgi:uncharacterized membrane protein YidH (DUF202 family)
MFPAQLTKFRHIVLVSMVYLLTFISMFLIIGEWPAYSPVIGAAMVAIGSVLMAWVGTLRFMEHLPNTERPFLAPSLAHGFICAVMLVVAMTV